MRRILLYYILLALLPLATWATHRRWTLMVGFQSSRYFSQCFRQAFGMTPSEYRSGSE